MSDLATRWAGDLRLSRGGGAAKAVLCVLAWHHNGKTGRCDPGVKTIAYEACIARNTARDALLILKELGAITYEDVTGKTYSFCLNIGWRDPAAKPKPQRSKPPTRMLRGSMADPPANAEGGQTPDNLNFPKGGQLATQMGSMTDPELRKEQGIVAPTAPVSERRAALRTSVQPDLEVARPSPVAARESTSNGEPTSPGQEDARQERRDGKPLAEGGRPPGGYADDDQWRVRMRGYRPGGFWPLEWGPRPGEPGCRVPVALITKLNPD
ncbi:MAG: helix-turn-helix domain-containing protein [Reyranella sp.]